MLKIQAIKPVEQIAKERAQPLAQPEPDVPEAVSEVQETPTPSVPTENKEPGAGGGIRGQKGKKLVSPVGASFKSLSDRDGGVRFRFEKEIYYQKWDQADETAWFKERFPDVPLTVLSDLSKIAARGHTAWGAYLNASVYLHENAAKGTAHHEAFHVFVDLMLTPEQRADLLQGRSEEALAEDFRQYVDNSGSFLGLVENFFQRVLGGFFVRAAVTGRASVQEYFHRINQPRPMYATSEGRGFAPQYSSGFDPITEARRVQMINSLFFNTVDEMLLEEQYAGLTDAELITANMRGIYERVFGSIIARYPGGRPGRVFV